MRYLSDETCILFGTVSPNDGWIREKKKNIVICTTSFSFFDFLINAFSWIFLPSNSLPVTMNAKTLLLFDQKRKVFRKKKNAATNRLAIFLLLCRETHTTSAVLYIRFGRKKVIVVSLVQDDIRVSVGTRRRTKLVSTYSPKTATRICIPHALFAVFPPRYLPYVRTLNYVN